MRSKTSKPSLKRFRPQQREFRPWKAASDYSETELLNLAKDLAQELRPGDRVLLEGPMGAGKSTFARALLESLGVKQAPEGSPSFAIAHEYMVQDSRLDVVHIDFYRIRSEAEITEAGIEAYFWERQGIVIAEWTSLWSEFESAITNDERRIWRVELAFTQSTPELRRAQIAMRPS